MAVTFTAFFLDLVVALGLGGLIGLEREHRGDDRAIIAGVRTFPLLSATGYLVARAADIVPTAGGFVVAAGVLGASAIAIAFLIVRHQLGVTGLTTPMAMIVTFLLGLFIGFGLVQEAIVVGVATTFLLLTKRRLHRFAHVLDDRELMSALQFLAVLFILFPIARALDSPLLGQSWLGRGGIVDPYTTLLVVIFVSAISFVSFVAMRFVGARRGVAASGLLGGLVNSEATSVSLATYANKSSTFVVPAVVGSLLATTTMFVRNFAIAVFADPSFRVALFILPVLVPLAVFGGVFAFATYRRGGADLKADDDALPRLKNPFAVMPAVRFAVLFLGIGVIAALAQDLLGPVGVYATALGAFVSAGAVVASVSALVVAGEVSVNVAGTTAVLATLIGVANKLVILRAVNRDVYLAARTPFMLLTALAVVATTVVLVAL